jgi:steroid delta-isomerase-like uncharacterized protein
MSLQENKVLVRRFVEEVQNKHNLSALDELFSQDFIDYSGMTNPPDIEGSKLFFSMLYDAFPDMRFSIRQQLAEGDQVMTYKTFHGTHQGTYLGIPATGKEISFDVIDILTIREGKVVEHWMIGDIMNMMQQLGGVPSPG